MKHFLRKISLFTTTTILALSSYAQSFEYEGIYYILDKENTTATVTYQGNNPEDNNYKGEIVLPIAVPCDDDYYIVTSIGEKAFYGCEGLEYVKISELVETIGVQAFGDNKMSSLIIPENVTSIAEDAFKGSNISLFMLGAFDDYSFLKNVSAGTSVFAPEAALQTIMDAWPGKPKSIEEQFYVEDLSTMTTIAFRLHKTEYYSLPNSLPFEFSSVITQGVEIFPDPETGVYSWGSLSPDASLQFVINYNVNDEDLSQIVTLKAAMPAITCVDKVTTATSFAATLVASEEKSYIPTEKGIVVGGTMYKADESGKVEINDLAEETEYTAKPYAVYKNKTYYGSEFTFTTKNSTGIANAVAGNESAIALNNQSRNGYIEISVGCEGEVAYSIINVTGQKEKEGVISGENKLNTINTSELSSGVYLINVNGNKINKTMKIIIK